MITYFDWPGPPMKLIISCIMLNLGLGRNKGFSCLEVREHSLPGPTIIPSDFRPLRAVQNHLVSDSRSDQETIPTNKSTEAPLVQVS